MSRAKPAVRPEFAAPPAHGERLLYTMKDLVSVLGLSYCEVRGLVLAGILPRVKVPSAKTRGVCRRLLVDHRDVLACIDAWKGGAR